MVIPTMNIGSDKSSLVGIRIRIAYLQQFELSFKGIEMGRQAFRLAAPFGCGLFLVFVYFAVFQAGAAGTVGCQASACGGQGCS